MSQTIKITIAAAGTDTGPFNLFSDADAYVTAFATGIAKSSLLAGYTSTVVPDAATIVRVKSNSVGCTNYVDMEITSAPSCTCRQGIITDNNAFSYTDCSGVFFSGGAELGSEVCVNIDLPYSANIGNLTTSVICNCNSPEEYQIDNSATGTSGDACTSSTTTSIVWAESGNTVPMVGLILYTTTNPLANPFVGSIGWRKLTGPLGTYAVEIDTNGEITNYVTC